VAATIPAEDGLTPTEEVEAGEEAIKQIAIINKEKKAKQIIHKRRIKQPTLFMTSNLIDKVDASDIREFGNKLESPPTVVEELLLSQERQLAHFASDQGTSNVSSLLEFMQDHEAKGPKKVGSTTQNEEVVPTPMVDCNGESAIEEPSSSKKKIKYFFSVIKKSTKAKKQSQNLMSLIQIHRFLSWVQRQKRVELALLRRLSMLKKK
jgi:hypothetical protein